METDAIVADYLEGTTVIELARAHRRTNRTVARILREAGVAGALRRRQAEARRGRPSPAHLGHSALGGRPTGPQWAYIAGFFDGEGSLVQVASSAGGHARFHLSLVQKDPAPLRWLQSAVGSGGIHFANGTHRYSLQGQRAVFDFLLGVHRHLVVKRPKAEAALASLRADYGWEVPG